jgi:hypothetical protein
MSRLEVRSSAVKKEIAAGKGYHLKDVMVEADALLITQTEGGK